MVRSSGRTSSPFALKGSRALARGALAFVLLTGCSITAVDGWKDGPACCARLDELTFNRLEPGKEVVFALSAAQSANFDFGAGRGPVVAFRLPNELRQSRLRVLSAPSGGPRFMCPTAVFLGADKQQIATRRIELSASRSELGGVSGGLSGEVWIPQGAIYLAMYGDPADFYRSLGTATGTSPDIMLPGGIYIPGQTRQFTQSCAPDGDLFLRVD